jgi:hypothetical protein
MESGRRMGVWFSISTFRITTGALIENTTQKYHPITKDCGIFFLWDVSLLSVPGLNPFVKKAKSYVVKGFTRSTSASRVVIRIKLTSGCLSLIDPLTIKRSS